MRGFNNNKNIRRAIRDDARSHTLSTITVTMFSVLFIFKFKSKPQKVFLINLIYS